MKYRYSGPLSGVTLDNGQEGMLCPGADVELPPAHDYTQTLLALGHLAVLSAVNTIKAKTQVKGETNGR